MPEEEHPNLFGCNSTCARLKHTVSLLSLLSQSTLQSAYPPRTPFACCHSATHKVDGAGEYITKALAIAKAIEHNLPMKTHEDGTLSFGNGYEYMGMPYTFKTGSGHGRHAPGAVSSCARYHSILLGGGALVSSHRITLSVPLRGCWQCQ
jgi:hypothetical protein